MPNSREHEKSGLDFWDISYAITRLFTESESKASPFRSTLELLTRELGWEAATFWIVNESRMLLECSEFYDDTGNPHPNFETVSRAWQFPPDHGLPGLTWAQRRVIYVEDVVASKQFPRAWVAEAENLHCAVAFPLHVGKTVLGVIELFRAETRPLPAVEREFLLGLGSQIGVLLERLSAGKSLHAADAQFQVIAEAASVTVFTIDERSEILFTNRAVERLFGHKPDELIGQKLTMIMPEYLRHVHEHGLARYVATGERHISWDGVPLPGLHKNGMEIPLEIAFGEFWRLGKRVFTGFARRRADPARL
jgi:PAS domain S-box-containing protein